MLALAIAFASSPAEAGAQPFTRAVTDDLWFNAGWQQWMPRTVSSGAKIVLLEIDWKEVEPIAPPPGVDPNDPGGPEYNLTYVDNIVRRFQGTGIQVAFLITDAPRWAEAPGGPAELEQDGAWEPSATAFGQLATAIATRYSGSYPDPAAPGQTLPRVRYYQAWGEANFSIHLAPQWTNSDGTWVPTGPVIYRNMLNAFYAGITSVHADNVVITSGFGPYGDPAGGCDNPTGEFGNGCRMPPVEFEREMMCLHGEALQPEPCPDPPHFDALAIDPYEIGSPTTPAPFSDDVSVPDLGKLTRLANEAVSMNRALPDAPKQLWVTEFGYMSNPPSPEDAVSLTTQARWLEQAFYLFWKQGVSVAVWYLLADAGPDYVPGGLEYTGLYFYDGAPKPAAVAFQFPFVVAGAGRSAIAWGISPRTGRVAVQRQVGGSWKTLFRIRATAGEVFVRKIPARLHGSFRAVVDGTGSLVWSRQ